MAHYELEGWPVEPSKPDGEFVPERRVRCAWADRFLEAGTIDDLEYPYAPGCGAYASYMRIDPLGRQTGILNGLATYEEAQIHVWYSSKVNTNAAIIEWTDATECAEPSAPKQLYWADNTPIHERSKPFVMRSGCTFHHVRRKLAVVPSAVYSQLDCVNASAATSDILGITFAAETLRAMMPEVRRTYTVSGLTSFYVHQAFTYRSNGGYGWNAGYRADTGTFGYVYNASGTRVRDYSTSNLTLV